MSGKHLHEQIEQILARLALPVDLINVDDAALPASAAGQLVDGVAVASGGRMYLAVSGTNLVLACAADQPGARDVLLLAGELVSTLADLTEKFLQ